MNSNNELSTAPQQYNDEIDLVELFTTVWQGKWQILSFVFVAVLGVLGFNFTQPAPSFTATTEIKPISSVDAELYRTSNAVGFFEITPSLLQQLYIEQLDERRLLESAIRKYELLDRAKFKTEELYNEAVIEFAASVSLLPPVNVDGIEKGEVRRYWTIGAEYNNDEKWKAVLTNVNSEVTEKVRTALVSRFQTSVEVAKQKKNFQLDDLATQIKNAKQDFDKEMSEFELKQGFQLEDVDTQIRNALADYDRKTADRLAFLREQAAIARKLGVSKNTIEAQMFTAQNGVVANVKTDTPFYLRGYEAIEKEIELIESREDKKSFVAGLLDLEQKKRALEQDKTLQRAEKNKVFLASLLELEKQQRKLQQDKTLERAEMLLATTPLHAKNDFKAVNVTVESTDFEYKSKRMLMLALAVVLGGMIGVVYVLITSAVRKRKGEQVTA
jgi:LPS O-antigen subunit length determinant protein (WzzB/FepE family)